MPNTDESTREKQLHNELKEIASLENHCAASGCANFFGYYCVLRAGQYNNMFL